MRSTLTGILLTSGLIFGVSCSSKKDSGGEAPAVTEEVPPPSTEDLSTEPAAEFAAICNGEAGEQGEKDFISFVKEDLISRNIGVTSCEQVYTYFNTPSTPGAEPVYLDMIGPREFDVSALRFFGSLESMVINGVTISDWTPFGQLANLRDLIVINSGLSGIPAEWSGMTGLLELAIQDPAFSSVESIGGLTSLLNLTLFQTNIADHSGLGGLASLQALVLAETGLTAVPATWKDMTSLQFTAIQSQPLTDVSGFSGLPALTEIEFSQTAVTDFSGLGNLPGLISIVLSQSGITSIPASWSALTSLEVLILQNEAITDLTNLSGVPSLVGFEISNAPVASLDPIASLVNLDVLIAGGVGMTAIPASWSALTNIGSLILHTETAFDMVDVSQFTNLVRLDLIDLGIAALSDISALVNLQLLNISGNENIDLANINLVPANLATLILQANGLTAVPPLGTLTALSGLALDGNELLADYSALNGNTTIRRLTLAQNGITDIPAEIATLAQLEALGAATNSITSVASIQGLANLAAIDFQGNPIDVAKSPENCPADAVSPAIKAYCTP